MTVDLINSNIDYLDYGCGEIFVFSQPEYFVETKDDILKQLFPEYGIAFIIFDIIKN